jgi:hypothetical protein
LRAKGQQWPSALMENRQLQAEAEQLPNPNRIYLEALKVLA